MFNCIKEIFYREDFMKVLVWIQNTWAYIYAVPKISSFFDENVEIVNMLSFSSLGRMDKLKKSRNFSQL